VEDAPDEQKADDQAPADAAGAADADEAAPPKPELENVIIDGSKDPETKALFQTLLLKVKSSNYSIYDFRKLYDRTYLYKEVLDKELEFMIAEMRIKESKRKGQENDLADSEKDRIIPEYQILGHNIIFVEFDSVNEEQNYAPIRNFRYIF
jgi:hypothetical protein